MVWVQFVPMPSADVPPVVQRVVQRNAAGVRGVIVHDRHTTIDVHAGPVHFTQTNDAVLFMIDGTDRRVRFVEVMQNGRAETVQQREKMGDDVTEQLLHGKGFFKEPYDPHYALDYTYSIDSACVCPSGEIEIQFTSALHDDQHGSGEMRINAATDRVRTETYTPFVFPPHADGGTIIETLGEPLPGLWTIVRIDRYYTGHAFLVTGHGVVTETLDRFRRFPNTRMGLDYYRNAAAAIGFQPELVGKEGLEPTRFLGRF